VEEVKGGSVEQSKGIQLIAKQMTGMERVTQGAAARAEEGAATGQQMQAHADSLHGIVQSLHAMVG
jgi:methyl-accepting chemotaxis protein